MEAQATWFTEFSAADGCSSTRKHVTNDSSGRRYQFTVIVGNNYQKLKFRTKLLRTYEHGHSCKEEVKLNWEYKLDVSIATTDGRVLGECAGKWSGVCLECPEKKGIFNSGEEVENLLEMDDPIDEFVNAQYSSRRNQAFILKMAYKLKTIESAEKKIPIEKTTTGPIETIIVQKTSPCLEHLIKKRNSDVLIKCGTSQLDAHKLVLSCCSPVFSRMFASQLEETLTNCVTIDDFDVETVKDMISFMYEGTISSSSKESLVALLDCAEKYEISELKVLVLEKMIASLSTENALEFAAASTKYGADPGTKATLFEYCKLNFQSLSTNAEFKKFFKQNVDLFL